MENYRHWIYVDASIGLANTNARIANDVMRRILFDATFTYFPIDVVLVIVGLIELILYYRRRI